MWKRNKDKYQGPLRDVKYNNRGGAGDNGGMPGGSGVEMS